VKICLITALFNPYVVGGAEIYVERIANELAKNNEVTVISTKPYHGLSSLRSSVELNGNLKIYRFYPLNVYYGYHASKKSMWIKPIWHLIDIWNPHAYFAIKKILEKEKPNIIHTHNLEILSTSALSAINALKIPHVHTVHDYLLLNRYADLLRGGEVIKEINIIDKLYQNFMKRLSNSQDIVLAPSKFVLDIHTKSGFFSCSKCMKLPLGIRLSNKHAQKKYDRIDILYVGGLSRHKGVHLLITAFKSLEGKNIRLHIIGKGKDEKKFKRLAEGDSRIIFHGFVPDEELRLLYQKANITVVPSIWYDNSPMVIYESLNDGTPVIGSRIGGIPELIEGGYNGFLFEAGNVDELKEILGNLIKNPEPLKRLEDGAFESVKKYDMDTHVKRLEEIYKECL
jgi:glycosyltransferase involved in cell wall biosynthesis